MSPDDFLMDEGDLEDFPDPIAEAIKPLVEKIDLLLAQNERLMQLLAAPKRVVRDNAGRVVGVRAEMN